MEKMQNSTFLRSCSRINGGSCQWALFHLSLNRNLMRKRIGLAWSLSNVIWLNTIIGLQKVKRKTFWKKKVSFTAGQQLRKLVVFLGSGKNKCNLKRLSIHWASLVMFFTLSTNSEGQKVGNVIVRKAIGRCWVRSNWQATNCGL